MKITQVELRYGDDHQVCWLPATYKWKPGMLVTLKGEHKMWEVKKVYSTQEHYEINKKWDVGGL